MDSHLRSPLGLIYIFRTWFFCVVLCLDKFDHTWRLLGHLPSFYKRPNFPQDERNYFNYTEKRHMGRRAWKCIIRNSQMSCNILSLVVLKEINLRYVVKCVCIYFVLVFKVVYFVLNVCIFINVLPHIMLVIVQKNPFRSLLIIIQIRNQKINI